MSLSRQSERFARAPCLPTYVFAQAVHGQRCDVCGCTREFSPNAVAFGTTDFALKGTRRQKPLEIVSFSSTAVNATMHASRFPGNLVTHTQPAPVHDMSAVWNLAARLRLCNVPVRLTQAISPFNYASTIGKEPTYLFRISRIEESYAHLDLSCIAGGARAHARSAPYRREIYCTATATGQALEPFLPCF